MKSILFLGCLLILTVTLMSYLVLQGVKQDQQKQVESHLAQETRIANMYIRQTFLLDTTSEFVMFLQVQGDDLAKQLELMSGMPVAIYDMNGNEVGNSVTLEVQSDVTAILSYALKDNIAYQTSGDYMDYMAPIYDFNGQIGVIKFRYSLKQSMAFYENVKSLFINIGVGILILSFVVGYFYFNGFVSSILKLKQDTNRIENGEYDLIVPFKKKDEIGELSRDIHRMSQQIETYFEEMTAEHEKLSLAVEKLKKLERKQKEFIGNITHEFKTPLTVIKAYVDLLDMYDDDPQLLADSKRIITKESDRLYEMVEKTLLLSSVEKYDFELQTEKVDTKALIEDVCQRMSGKAMKFQIELSHDLVEAHILGDKESLMQIFINLIDNGIKYNVPEGKVSISSRIEKDNVYIEIQDTGIGIPADDRSRVFEAFYTVSKDRAKSTGGTGLGLSLVRELVNKQRGEIRILDKVGKGTTFLIEFPLVS